MIITHKTSEPASMSDAHRLFLPTLLVVAPVPILKINGFHLLGQRAYAAEKEEIKIFNRCVKTPMNQAF